MPNKPSLCKLSYALGICTSFLFLQGCSEQIDARQAEVNNGLIYKLHDSEPFTGKLTNYAFSGGETYVPATANAMPIPLRNCVIELKKGLRDGSAICKSDGGAKTGEVQFKGGVKAGAEKHWDAATGKLIFQAEWQDSDHLTKEENFDPNSGNRIYEASWTKWSYGRRIDGEVRAFDASGKLKNHFVFSGGEAKDAQTPSGASTPVVVRPTAETSETVETPNSEMCLDSKIAKFHKEQGNDAVISNDMIIEWKTACAGRNGHS